MATILTFPTRQPTLESRMQSFLEGHPILEQARLRKLEQDKAILAAWTPEAEKVCKSLQRYFKYSRTKAVYKVGQMILETSKSSV